MAGGLSLVAAVILCDRRCTAAVVAALMGHQCTFAVLEAIKQNFGETLFEFRQNSKKHECLEEREKECAYAAIGLAPR